MALEIRNPTADSSAEAVRSGFSTSIASSSQNMVWTETQRWQSFIKQKALKRTPRSEVDKIWYNVSARLALWKPRYGALRRRIDRVLKLDSHYAPLPDAALRDKLSDLRDRFRRKREQSAEVDHALAAIREQAYRVTGLKAYPNQIMAADALYHQYMAEVATGEGKTLIAAMAGVILGWRGEGCHIVTVNDYLATRDAENLQPFFSTFGLEVSAIAPDMTPPQRCEAYAKDVTYVTNKEACADYLRDQLNLQDRSRLSDTLLDSYRQLQPAFHRLVMRGRAAAIVDEVDSILLDEAATPLLISGDAPNAESEEAYRTAAKLAPSFEHGRDYTVKDEYREVRLTRQGRERASTLCAEIGGLFASARRREELIAQALTARIYYLRDDQYVIEQDKIIIIDESTGRQMPDRTWRDGLHQAVEAKEELEVTPPKATFARLSFQRFFRGYIHLCGMSGTTWEGRHEFQMIYSRGSVRIPTHRPIQRKFEGKFVFRRSSDRWDAVVRRILALHEHDLPILVGTYSVEASEHISKLLAELEVEHAVLNAVRHREEAEIVKRAGEPGTVTIATNMAGRGTDIRVSEKVQKAGGLYVLSTHINLSPRVDRQFLGRTGRQGQPGCASIYVSLEDQLVTRYLPRMLHPLAKRLTQEGRASWSLRLLLHYAQYRSEKSAYVHRKQVLRQDEWLEDHVGFAPGGF